MDMNAKASNARKESPLSLAVAAQLRAERAAASLTVEQLARQSGVSKNSLLAVLNGKRTADVTQLDAICRALKVSLLDLFTRAEERLAAERAAAAGGAAQVSGE